MTSDVVKLLEQSVDDVIAQRTRLERKLKEAMRDIRDLRATLERVKEYADHKSDCASLRPVGSFDAPNPCSCGLPDALNGLREIGGTG